MSLAFLLPLLMVLLVSCRQAPDEARPRFEPIAIESLELGLDDLKLDSDIVGNVRYRGGVHLNSPDRRFGGLSWLNISADGRSFVALSDRGYRFHGELVYDVRENLVGIVDTRIESLPGTDKGLFRSDKEGECEAMARAPGGGMVIAFERGRRLIVYPEGGEPPRSMAPPEDSERPLAIEGIKAMTLMLDDRLLVFMGGPKTGTDLVGWVGGKNGWSRVTYRTCTQRVEDMRHKVEARQCFPPQNGPTKEEFEEFWPVGATTLPEGDILVVESGFPYVATRLSRLQAANIKPGAMLDPEQLALLEGALAFHNIRGIDTRQGSKNRTMVYLVSDNNYTGPQPTAFLMFELIR